MPNLSANASVLIESDWNLKGVRVVDVATRTHSINRIRLEFKVQERFRFSVLILCINRIRLEFKVHELYTLDHSRFFVLIESDWNLK